MTRPVDPFQHLDLKEIKSLMRDHRDFARSLRVELKRQQVILDQLSQAKLVADPPEFMISDHAVVRYLERVVGAAVLVQGVRDTMRAALTAGLPDSIGEHTVELPGGRGFLVVCSGRVTTVLEPDQVRIGRQVETQE